MLFLTPALMSSLGYAIIAYAIALVLSLLFLGTILGLSGKKADKTGHQAISLAIAFSKLIAIGVFLIKLF